MTNKFNSIYESYINGNISWVKAEVKKLSKANRKDLYNFVNEFNNCTRESLDIENQKNDDANFFFNLI